MTQEAKDLADKWLKEMDKHPIQLANSTLIKVSEEFHFNGKGLWLGMERTSNPAEDLTSQFVKAHEELATAFKAISGQTLTDFNSGEKEVPKVIDRGKETLMEIINDCTTKEELIKQRDNVTKYGLIDFYCDKMEELS